MLAGVGETAKGEEMVERTDVVVESHQGAGEF